MKELQKLLGLSPDSLDINHAGRGLRHRLRYRQQDRTAGTPVRLLVVDLLPRPTDLSPPAGAPRDEAGQGQPESRQ
jgi:hypothetical protein